MNSKLNAIRNWIRLHITMPLANYFIGCNKRYSLSAWVDDVCYEAEYHRARYYYDSERITLRGIISKRHTWHITYWDKGKTPGLGGVEMTGPAAQILTGFKYDIWDKVYDELVKAIYY